MPLAVGLELLKVLLEADILALAHSLEHVLYRERGHKPQSRENHNEIQDGKDARSDKSEMTRDNREAASHLDSGHHALEAAEVDVGTLVQGVKNLIGVLLNLVLDVHLAALLVERALAGKRVVKADLVRVGAEVSLELLIVEEGILVGHTEEKPCEALEVLSSRGALQKEAFRTKIGIHTDQCARLTSPKRRRRKLRKGAMPVPVATMM